MTMLSLICHPSSTTCPVRTITVGVERPAAGRLVLRYRVEGDIAGLYVPAKASPARGNELWKHTCFEAFIGRHGAPGYLELNFSPSTEWAAHRFDDYRQGMAPVTPACPPVIVCRSRVDLLEMDVDVPLEGLDGPLRLGLSAVIEDRGGQNTCWALTHPADAPDFHHPDSFTLTR